MIFNHPTTFILSNLNVQSTPQTSSSLPQQAAGGSEGAIWSPCHKISPLLPAHISSQPHYHRRSRPSSFSGFLLSSRPSHAITHVAVIDRNQDPLPPAPAPAQPERNSFNQNNNNHNNTRHRINWQGDGHTSFPAGVEEVEVLGDLERGIGGRRSNRRQNRTSYQLVMEQLERLDAVMESEAEGADRERLEPAVFLYGASAIAASGPAAGGSVDGQEEEEEEDQVRLELGLQVEEPPVPMPSSAASRRRTWIR
ncbi:hypothetical protein BKA57DRAFT_473141 [Linnemannia elongata]|nr:hypothetical protein BKA57DRAFT_473141 [Linnemannia elongata]